MYVSTKTMGSRMGIITYATCIWIRLYLSETADTCTCSLIIPMNLILRTVREQCVARTMVNGGVENNLTVRVWRARKLITIRTSRNKASECVLKTIDNDRHVSYSWTGMWNSRTNLCAPAEVIFSIVLKILRKWRKQIDSLKRWNH